jgi:hypothetical protein
MQSVVGVDGKTSSTHTAEASCFGKGIMPFLEAGKITEVTMSRDWGSVMKIVAFVYPLDRGTREDGRFRPTSNG